MPSGRAIAPFAVASGRMPSEAQGDQPMTAPRYPKGPVIVRTRLRIHGLRPLRISCPELLKSTESHFDDDPLCRNVPRQSGDLRSGVLTHHLLAPDLWAKVEFLDLLRRLDLDESTFLEGQAASPIVSHLDTRIKSSEVQDRPVERRSLADFAKLVELFDAHGVSFVSVTQQFLRVNYRLEKEGPFDPGEMILSGSIP